MKKILLIVSAILVYVSSYGQSKSNDYKTMVDSAVLMQKKVAYKQNIYLIDEKNQPYILSSEKLPDNFKYIFLYEKRNRKILKKGINAWKILPVLNGNKLTIDIVSFVITYKKNNYAFGNGGGGKVVFEYSCETAKWVLLETKWSGV